MTNFVPPFGDPFGPPGGYPPPQGYGPPPQGFVPPHQGFGPPRPAPPQPAPARPNAVGAVWSMVALVVGIMAAALMMVLFYTDAPYWLAFVGAALGIVGVAAGVAGLRYGRTNGINVVPGVVAGGVAIVLAVVAVLIHVNGPAGPSRNGQASATPASAATYDTATVLRDELEVSFGKLEYTLRNGLVSDTRLPVTFHNKLNVTRDFDVAIGGFDGEHTQIADSVSGTNPGPIAANATTTIDYFTVGLQLFPDVAERLKSSTFRVIMATSKAV